jgi:thiol-disulfide isomerase/thioredoxin
MTPDSARNPAPNAHGKKRRQLWSWLLNLVLIAVAFGAVTWWKNRPLVSGPAPPLAGVTLSGHAFDLGIARTEPILVHFWATWCPVCQMMDGTIDAIAKDHRVITVALHSGTAQEIARYMRQAGLAFPVMADPDGQIASRWGVSGAPTTFVVDAAGQIRAATVGDSTGPGLRARLWLAVHGEARR